MENCYYGNICHPEQRYRRTDIWSTLLQWGNVWETTVSIISAILSKIENKVVFVQICYPEQNGGKRAFWSCLPHWAKIRKKWEFDLIYYTRRNTNKMNFCSDLQSWAKLLKNEFWSLLPHWAKMWEITTLTEFAKESKSVQKFIFDRFCPFEQKPDKCQFCYQVWHPYKCLDKVKVILVFTHGANVRQMRHLPPLPLMQNHGKFGPTSWGKIEQN